MIRRCAQPFRERLRFAAMCRGQVPLTPEDAAEVNMLRQASFIVKVDGETVGTSGLGTSGPIPERTVEVFSQNRRWT
jgi:hypothetical protein